MAFLGGPLLSGKRSLGASLGADLGSALQSLAEHKTQQMHTNEKSKFWQSLGLDSSTSRAIAGQPEAIQKSVLDRLEGANFGSQQDQFMPQQQVQQAMPQQPTYTPEQTNLLKSIPNPSDRSRVAAMFQQQNQPQVNSTEPSERFGQAAAQQQAIEKAAELRPQGVRLGANPQERRHQETLQQQRDLLERKELHAQQKHDLERFEKKQDESKKVVQEINSHAKGAKENNMRLDKMEALINSGKLSNPGFSSALKSISKGIFGFGIDLNHLQNPESQEFEKLSADFLNSIKDVFGSSKITNLEIENFLKTVPNVSQSNEAKKAVIDNLRVFNEGKILKQKAAKDIIKANNNIIPADIDILVEERVEPQLNKLADQFKANISKEVVGTEGLLTSTIKAIPRLVF